MDSSKMKIVYTITERGERSYWTRIGVAYVNRDGSLNIKLEAVPVNGTMQVRDWTPREDQAGSEDRLRKGNGNGAQSSAPQADDLPDAFS
ncbi:MAG: hypothetical protein HY898_07595 [Deltaproteobacteria bacterium]|nr:hypothetical protein [Deltaproteobacteria bacterium]